MPIAIPAAARLRRAPRPVVALVAVTVAGLLAACSSSPSPSGSLPAPSASGQTAIPTASPTPTPQPTPDFSSHPDPTLSALIPATVRGAPVVKPDPTTFGISPGDVGSVFGDVGLRFRSLVIAYIVSPRLSLYAIGLDGHAVDTAELRPFLPAAGQLIGASDLRPELWKAAVVNGNRVWTRGADDATLVGTTFYCWSSGQYVFLLTGSSDAANRAMVSALPGQPAPTPTPVPSASPVSSGTPAGSPTPAASGSASAAASAGS